MSNKISRRTFLKCTGASAAALGAAAMLGGCGSSTSNAIEVKVGDKVSNWNNLGVHLDVITQPDTDTGALFALYHFIHHSMNMAGLAFVA